MKEKLQKGNNMNSFLKRSYRSILCLLISLLLFGCADSVNYKKQIEDLENQKIQLLTQIGALQEVSFNNLYKNGSFECSLEQATYSLSIRFLAKTVIHLYGVDVNGMTIFDNYYLLKVVDLHKFTMVDDIFFTSYKGPATVEYLTKSNFFLNFSISEDGKTLTLTPSKYVATCNFVKD